MAEKTLGEKLIALKQRSGLSLEDIAKAAGYSGRSSVQKLFNEAYDAEALSPGIAKKLEKALAGKGGPQISPDEIWALSDLARAGQSTAAAAVNVESLEIILVEVLRASANIEIPASLARPTAATLVSCIELVAKNPAIRANRDAIRAVVHAVAARPPSATPGAPPA